MKNVDRLWKRTGQKLKKEVTEYSYHTTEAHMRKVFQPLKV